MEGNEVTMLIFSIAVLFFTFVNHSRIKKISRYKVLLCSFYLFLISCVATVAESFAANSFFNFFEHLSFFLSILILAVWIFQVRSKVYQ